MLLYPPIGSCCAKPRFNAASGANDCAYPREPHADSIIFGDRKIDRTTVFSAAGILAALVGFALVLIQN